VVRTAFQALSAVLGGTQSLHTNGLDEAYAIPSEHAMKVALRTQQIIADETGAANVIDPLGGSWYVEKLTSDFEAAIGDYLKQVDELGGTIAAIEANFFQREIADSAYDFAVRKGSGDRIVVGVNKYVDEGEEPDIEIHKIDPETEQNKIADLRRIKSERDQARVDELLRRLREVALDPSANLMPATIEAVKAHASMGEIVSTLEGVFGRYTESPVF
jgi:methylmalonyl-CoA mutase cobalamin-binding domain/chain